MGVDCIIHEDLGSISSHLHWRAVPVLRAA